LTRSFADADVTKSTSSGYGGVLIGWSRSGLVEDCYAVGSIDGLGPYLGGLIGLIWADSATSDNRNCWSAVEVRAASGDGVASIAPTEGSLASGMYWDIDASGTTTSDVGTGLATEDMLREASFDGWDFSDVWQIDEGVSYPCLQWQTECPVPEP
jgi:hypothetical protein